MTATHGGSPHPRKGVLERLPSCAGWTTPGPSAPYCRVLGHGVGGGGGTMMGCKNGSFVQAATMPAHTGDDDNKGDNKGNGCPSHPVEMAPVALGSHRHHGLGAGDALGDRYAPPNPPTSPKVGAWDGSSAGCRVLQTPPPVPPAVSKQGHKWSRRFGSAHAGGARAAGAVHQTVSFD